MKEYYEGTIRAALAHVDPGCTRTEWVLIGTALRHHFQGEEANGYALFGAWSAGEFWGDGAPANYDADVMVAQWGSFNPKGGVSIASLLYEAVKHGWVAQAPAMRELCADGPPHKPTNGGPWVPELETDYYVISHHGPVTHNVWGGTAYGLGLLAMGNVYPTHKAAEAARDRQLATVKVLRRIAELNAAEGWVADWSDECQEKHSAMMDNFQNVVRSKQVVPSEWYGSKRTIESVIAELGPEIRLMLGVAS